MKKGSLYVLALLMLMSFILFTAACTNNKTQSTGSQTEKVLRIDEENLGYPSVYTVSSRGRGYLLMSFIFDTLTWKDENGVIPLLAEKWDISADQKVLTFTL